MISVFGKILTMSIASGILAIAVIVIRALIKKAPRWITLVLWALVGLRLICPFTIPNPYSLQPEEKAEVYPVIDADGEYFDLSLPYQLPPPELTDTQDDNTAVRAETPSLYAVLSTVWLTGCAGMLAYAVVSYMRMVRLTKGSVCKNGVYMIKGVTTPFVFGFFKPKIYVPYGFDADKMHYVVEHERTHLSRLDHIWKPVSFVILSVHWFNPLIWVSYLLFCRDIESSCDERVIKGLNDTQRASYAQALLDCSTGKGFTVCPVAFGENGVKERIKAVLKYKKPAIWITVVAIILCVGVAFFFMTHRKDNEEIPPKDGITVTVDRNNGEEFIVPDDGESLYDAQYRFPGIHEIAVEYALDLGYDISAKHYKSGASFGRVSKIVFNLSEKVKPDEKVELYYMEYDYYEGTISPGEDDKKFVYPIFFALHHNEKTDKWTRIGTVYDYQLKNKYKTDEMIELYGDEFTAAAVEMYKDFFFIDMGEKEQMILFAYKSASEAASWFRNASILESAEEYPEDTDDYVEIDDRRYYKVKRFATYAEFKEYLEMRFSKELVKEFLDNGEIKYIDRGGELYASLGIRSTDIHVGSESYYVEKVSEGKYVVHVTVYILGDDAVTIVGSKTYDFSYEFMGDRRGFTDFPQIR